MRRTGDSLTGDPLLAERLKEDGPYPFVGVASRRTLRFKTSPAATSVYDSREGLKDELSFPLGGTFAPREASDPHSGVEGGEAGIEVLM